MIIELIQLCPPFLSRTHPLTPSLATRCAATQRKRRGTGLGGHPPLFSREGDQGGEFNKNNIISNYSYGVVMHYAV